MTLLGSPLLLSFRPLSPPPQSVIWWEYQWPTFQGDCKDYWGNELGKLQNTYFRNAAFLLCTVYQYVSGIKALQTIKLTQTMMMTYRDQAIKFCTLPKQLRTMILLGNFVFWPTLKICIWVSSLSRCANFLFRSSWRQLLGNTAMCTLKVKYAVSLFGRIIDWKVRMDHWSFLWLLPFWFLLQLPRIFANLYLKFCYVWLKLFCF